MKSRIVNDSDKTILLCLNSTNLLRKPHCFTPYPFCLAGEARFFAKKLRKKLSLKSFYQSQLNRNCCAFEFNMQNDWELLCTTSTIAPASFQGVKNSKLQFVGVLALQPIIKSFAELFQKRRLAGGAVMGLCFKLQFAHYVRTNPIIKSFAELFQKRPFSVSRPKAHRRFFVSFLCAYNVKESGVTVYALQNRCKPTEIKTPKPLVRFFFLPLQAQKEKAHKKKNADLRVSLVATSDKGSCRP